MNTGPGDISLLSAHVTKERIDRQTGESGRGPRVSPFVLLHARARIIIAGAQRKWPGELSNDRGVRTFRNVLGHDSRRFYSTRRPRSVIISLVNLAAFPSTNWFPADYSIPRHDRLLRRGKYVMGEEWRRGRWERPEETKLWDQTLLYYRRWCVEFFFFFSIIGINEGKTLCLREVFEMKVSFGGWDKNKGKIILCSWTDNVHIIYLFFFLFLAVFKLYRDILYIIYLYIKY